jgi:hypothetical protein
MGWLRGIVVDAELLSSEEFLAFQGVGKVERP